MTRSRARVPPLRTFCGYIKILNSINLPCIPSAPHIHPLPPEHPQLRAARTNYHIGCVTVPCRTARFIELEIRVALDVTCVHGIEQSGS